MSRAACSLPFARMVSLAMAFIMGFTFVPNAAAQTPPDNLAADLSSAEQTITVESHMLSSGSVTINVGGQNRVINPGDSITAAEYMALQSVLHSGVQTLLLDASGRATAGSFQLQHAGTNLASLIVPTGVTGVATASLVPYTVAGLLSTHGSIVGSAASSAANTALSLIAGDVYVGQGGLISTILSGPELGSQIIDLNIRSEENIFNAGTISSSGNLSLAALGSIVNAAGGLITAGGAVKVNASSGSITNSGVITSDNGSVVFSTGAAVPLILDNHLGKIEAVNGTIQLRDAAYRAKLPTAILGGLVNAPAINIFGGNGHVEVDVDEVRGLLNINGGTASVWVNEGNLTMGTMALTGDPNLVNTTGDIVLTQSFTLKGQDFAILAFGNITATPTVKLIDLSSTTAPGGDLHMLAGVNISKVPPPNPSGQTFDNDSYSVSGGSSVGGNIYLEGVTIKTGSTKGDGGKVVAVGNAGSAATGKVSLGPIDTSSTVANGGNVTVIGPGGVVLSGPVKSHGKLSGGTVEAGTWVPGYTAVFFNDGSIAPAAQIVGGATSASGDVIVGDTVKNNGLISTSATTGNSGNIFLVAADTIRVAGSLITNANGGNAGNVSLIGNDGLWINGDISAKGKVDGGTTVLQSNESVEVRKSITLTGGTNGGDLTINGKSARVGFIFSEENALPLLAMGTGINTSSTNGTGGEVTIETLNDIYIAKSIITSGKMSGADVKLETVSGALRVDDKIVTSSTKGSAGDMFITGGVDGDPTRGIDLKALDASGATGEEISITTRSNVSVLGAITTEGKVNEGGSFFFSVNSSKPVDINIVGNINTKGKNGDAGGVSVEDAGSILIDGYINTSASGIASSGGSVTLESDNRLVVDGYINTTSPFQAGSVVLTSNRSFITVNGAISANGLNRTNANAGTGGLVLLGNNRSTGVFVKGSINTSGGNSTGSTAGSGGAAGFVQIFTLRNTTFGTTPNESRVGGIEVLGHINSQGGSTTSATASGGIGNTVTLDGGFVRITGSLAGASVNTSGGKNKAGARNTDGYIIITTYGIQPIPQNFDMTSNKATEYVLPGAMFEVGSAVANGSQGKLVAGGTVVSNTKVLFAVQPFSVPGSGEVHIDTDNGIAQVDNLNVNNILTDFNVVNTPGIAASGRTKVTPAVALALMQMSFDLGATQTFGLNTNGTASNEAIAGGDNTVTLPSFAFGRPLSKFTLQALDNNGALSQDINLIVEIGPHHEVGRTGTAHIVLPETGKNLLGGVLSFIDAQTNGNNVIATVSGGSMLSIPNASSISAGATIDLALKMSKAAKIELAGDILAANLAIS